MFVLKPSIIVALDDFTERNNQPQSSNQKQKQTNVILDKQSTNPVNAENKSTRQSTIDAKIQIWF